ncbi:hypothetical protein XENOCAPTIV_000895 [Xenoophorus captivus]|uniref:Dopamine beta-hydroxylase n=1 Tax=Xenoophorus captivus TaxID=1517983 RepID=A0ABV0SCW7_9TELE
MKIRDLRCYFGQDAWSNSEGHVSLDSQQDYELIEAKKKADGFYLLFKRPFSTCDPRDYVIEYESRITPGNEAIVHHIEVFECATDLRDVPQYSGSCDDKMKPKKLNFCRHVLAAWAMGAEV